MRWGDPVTGGSVPLAVPDGRSFWGSAFRACSGIRLWRSVSFSSFTCSAGFRLPKSGGCRFGGLSRVPELSSLPDITGEKQAVVAGFPGLAEVFSARSFLSCASRGSFPGVWDRWIGLPVGVRLPYVSCPPAPSLRSRPCEADGTSPAADMFLTDFGAVSSLFGGAMFGSPSPDKTGEKQVVEVVGGCFSAPVLAEVSPSTRSFLSGCASRNFFAGRLGSTRMAPPSRLGSRAPRRPPAPSLRFNPRPCCDPARISSPGLPRGAFPPLVPRFGSFAWSFLKTLGLGTGSTCRTA